LATRIGGAAEVGSHAEGDAFRGKVFCASLADVIDDEAPKSLRGIDDLEKGVNVMADKDQLLCAVPGCINPCAGSASLCKEHRIPGIVFAKEGNTCVVTLWYVERGRRSGIIVLNDFSLGHFYGGAEGFKANLKQQGFSAIKLLKTPQEVDATKRQTAHTSENCTESWLTGYSWEYGTDGTGLEAALQPKRTRNRQK
jgi:hypothetical protein